MPEQITKDVAFRVDELGRIQGAQVNGRAATLSRRAPTLPNRGYMVLGNMRAADVAGLAGCVITDVTRVAEDGTLLRGIRMQATGGVACNVDFDFTASTLAGGRLGFLCYQDPSQTNGANISAKFFIATDATFAVNYSRDALTADSRGWSYWSPGDAAGNSPSKWVAAGGAAWGVSNFTRVRARLDYNNGELPWIELYEISLADDSTSWLSISIDDGYDTAYTIGAPELEQRGLRASFGIITDLVGQAGYMTWAQLRDLDARGHEMCVHGPIGGAGSLLNYAGLPASERYRAVYNDISTHQARLRDNGLDKNGSASVYILPQGQDKFFNGDETIRNVFRDLGIVGARRAGPGIQVKRSVRGRDAYTIPIIGHVWTSAGNEPGNIAGIQNLINAAAADKWDATLMLHKFVVGASADSLQIDRADFRTLLNTHCANRLAGTQQNVLFSQQVYALAGKTQPLGVNVF